MGLLRQFTKLCTLRSTWRVQEGPQQFLLRHFAKRMATSGSEKGHAERTAEIEREKIKSEADVIDVKALSSSIRGLTLQVADRRLTFKAGQWVDFFVPNMEIFTGYSVVSSPGQLERDGTLELAVRESDYPPTQWVHNECKVGSKVHIQAGGTFIYDPKQGATQNNVLLVAGGIGVTPIMSIVQHTHDLYKASQKNGGSTNTIVMLFSAGLEEDLIYKERLDQTAKDLPRFSVQYHVTKVGKKDQQDKTISEGRITTKVLESTLLANKLDSSKLDCYICGPPEMLDDIEMCLLRLNVPQSNIFYEKWW